MRRIYHQPIDSVVGAGFKETPSAAHAPASRAGLFFAPPAGGREGASGADSSQMAAGPLASPSEGPQPPPVGQSITCKRADLADRLRATCCCRCGCCCCCCAGPLAANWRPQPPKPSTLCRGPRATLKEAGARPVMANCHAFWPLGPAARVAKLKVICLVIFAFV